ncbi:LacI family DNA-binding transcriptional regulator [Brachybacterium saurashtrense]|uniref:LacI family transcriptional regulator n=1 Tax=Brachybacterium saurashtrense TaxID=556288 RepID=A0A345YS70_9MICO|nr:LacI family DNA-binding transcriptional regulator [Brachybacterium saurashtrense]AXK46772.1 LacI family transcriptional regulator [Brachybacterium saurashtrense]RRR22487.1 LacI family transcriptional regulator [Brachybacterium saurashtrense]
MSATRRSRASVTLAQVAEAAEVSLATASKAMNGRGAVSASTREKVAEAAQRLGYAQRPRRAVGRRRIVLHLEVADSPYVMGVLAGAESAARQAGADLLVVSSDGAGLSRTWMAEAAGSGVDGVVALTAPIGAQHVRWSRSLRLPLIVVDPILHDPSVEGLLAVSATNWEGGRSAVRHLLELGHRRIGLLNGPEGSVPGQQRAEGYRSALAAAGIPFDEELVHGGDFSAELGEEGAARLLALADPPTALFAASDNLAHGAMRAARARGLEIPADLSIVGFDDTMITRWTQPQLTAVRQPLFSLGQVAIERLLALLDDPSRFAHPFELRTQLIERESTGLAPSR